VTGRSVTTLEIEFGILDSGEQRKLSRFYLRQSLPYAQTDPVMAARYSDLHSADLTAKTPTAAWKPSNSASRHKCQAASATTTPPGTKTRAKSSAWKTDDVVGFCFTDRDGQHAANSRLFS
jgi:hypothetical protein